MIVPGMEPRTVNRGVSLLDIAPTVLDLLHVPAPIRLRGRSLLRLARDGNDPDYDHAVAAANHMGLYCFISQDGRWKLIWDTPRSTMELYDLIADPKERDNLVDENPDKLAEIRHERDRWLGSRMLTR
jgi:arylsulfatase A-like enzyme